MQTVILAIHNILRWAIVLFAVWTLWNALTGVISKRKYTGNDNRASLFFMIFCDLQLLIGLFLYFNYGWFTKLKNLADYKAIPAERFFIIEHMAMMILAWLLVHLGRTMVKKGNTDRAKHLRSLLFFGLAIALILAAIPWPVREAIARPWWRSFS